jgi:hypothetical protein
MVAFAIAHASPLNGSRLHDLRSAPSAQRVAAQRICAIGRMRMRQRAEVSWRAAVVDTWV